MFDSRRSDESQGKVARCDARIREREVSGSIPGALTATATTRSGRSCKVQRVPWEHVSAGSIPAAPTTLRLDGDGPFLFVLRRRGSPRDRLRVQRDDDRVLAMHRRSVVLGQGSHRRKTRKEEERRYDAARNGALVLRGRRQEVTTRMVGGAVW